LHPFIQVIELPATGRHPARSVGLRVSFGLHTFTRAVELHDGDDELYKDNREVRTFFRQGTSGPSNCQASSARSKGVDASSHEE
jgi:hypothetical protein